MGTTTSCKNSNNLETLNKTIALAVCTAQKQIQESNINYLKQYFNIEYINTTCVDTINDISNIILDPKKIKIKTDSGIIEIPICSLIKLNYMDIKNVHVETSVEIKSIKNEDIIMCPKHRGNAPSLKIEMDIESCDMPENIQRIVHKFHI